MTALFTTDNLISVYTRAQAIEDGELVDVSTVAREAGFAVPVALTRAVWEGCVEWTPEDNVRKGTYQDQGGRLWDVIWMGALCANKMVRTGLSTAGYKLLRVPREGRGRVARLVMLKIELHVGDEGEPVVTIMRPDED